MGSGGLWGRPLGPQQSVYRWLRHVLHLPRPPPLRPITPDRIICLEDGKQLKMLKRYLRTTHGMTPDEYRAKWGLPADYPMVAPNYAKQRSAFAKEIGLGKRGKR